ncbi:hypothetical protein Tco_0038736 [Tanacetum coccineum]
MSSMLNPSDEYHSVSELTKLHQRPESPFTTIRFRVFSDLSEYTSYLQSHYPIDQQFAEAKAEAKAYRRELTERDWGGNGEGRSGEGEDDDEGQ